MAYGEEGTRTEALYSGFDGRDGDGSAGYITHQNSSQFFFCFLLDIFTRLVVY